MITMKGEMGIPTVLSAPNWGYFDVLFKGEQFKVSQSFESYVMENVLFKISFPAEFHSQTAVEAAVTLHPEVKDKLSEIERIEVTTHESAIRIISKVGELANPADRDHCLQYMIAVPLIHGDLIAEHYEDSFHKGDARIDELRTKMTIIEDERYSKEYLDSDKRSIANAIQVFFKDGSSTQKVEVEYPIGHRRRRAEGIPVLEQKFLSNLRTRYPEAQCQAIYELCKDQTSLSKQALTSLCSL